MKHFINLIDITDIEDLVSKARAHKAEPFAHQHLGKNKTICLIFFNSSLRTRLSTQKAAQNLGLNVISLNVGSDSWGLEMQEDAFMNGDKAEHIKEAAAVVGAYADIIGVRAFAGLTNREEDYAELVLENFRKYAGVPIVNLESATRHPLQSLTDLVTIAEHKKSDKPKVVLTWLPHFKALPQAVGNSFAEWVNKTNYELVITHPEGYDLPADRVGGAKVIHDQNEALKNADFVYGKNWSSFNDYGKVLCQDSSWAITPEKMALTNNGFFMHCLPVRRGLKVADAVLDSPQALVVKQAANREWAAQAVLAEILKGLPQ